MRIFYQGFPGAYGHKASLAIASALGVPSENVEGLRSFSEVFDRISGDDLGVLPFENSYAGSIHENFYRMLEGGYRVLHERFQEVDHFLLAAAGDASSITEVHSHPQALMQCQKYLKDRGWEAKPSGDTAGAAKYVRDSNDPRLAAIASDLAAELYGLRILDRSIQDQKGNTTRFFLVAKNPSESVSETVSESLPKSGKASVVFRTKNIPAALYKCLGAFATRFVNLSKIESLPAKENRFEYVFWIDAATDVPPGTLESALEELRFFSTEVDVLGEY